MCDVGTGSGEAAIFNPSRDPGEMSGTNHRTASQGTLWAGQPGLMDLRGSLGLGKVWRAGERGPDLGSTLIPLP